MVGDIVTLPTRIDVEGTLSNALYRVEKIEYTNGSASCLELSAYTTCIGSAPAVDTSHHGNWLRVSLKETTVLPYIDDSCMPTGVLQATSQLKAKLGISGSTSAQSVSSVVSTALLPAVDTCDQTVDALLDEVTSLFSVTGAEDSTEAGTVVNSGTECKSGDSVKEGYAVNGVDGSVGQDVEQLVSQYRNFFSVISQFAVVIACYVDAVSATSNIHESVASKKVNVSESSLIVQDVEHDVTPMKQRGTSSTSTSTVKSPDNFIAAECTIVTVLEKLCGTLDRCVLLVAVHPQPLMVTMAAWSHSMGTVRTCIGTLNVLKDVVQHGSTASVELLERFNVRRRLLGDALTAQFGRTGSSKISFYELCTVDNIVRQDWVSHSKYMRDKKFTHGIVALYTSLRTSIWDMYQLQCKTNRTVLDNYDTVRGSNSTLCLQLLLNSTLLVCRTYMGVTELSATDCAELCLTDNCVRMLQPSRVRTAQWSKDLAYTAYMVFDTLAWIITQDTLLATRAGNSSDSEGSGVPVLQQLYATTIDNSYEVNNRATVNAAQRETLLLSPQYTAQADIIGEILLVLRYLLLSVFIVSEPDAQRVLDKLAPAMSNAEAPGAPNSTISNINGNSSRNVWQSLLEVAGSLSHFDTLTDLFTTEIVTSEGLPAVHRSQVSPDSAPVSVAVVRLPTTSFSTTVDVVSHCGMHAFHINDHNAAELALYAQEITLHTAAAAKDGGVVNRLSVEKAVVHQRIANMTVTRPQCLLRLLIAPESDIFLSVFMEVNGTPHLELTEGSLSMQRKFMVEMLLRRYEVNTALYPALTDNEFAAAQTIRQCITKLVS